MRKGKEHHKVEVQGVAKADGIDEEGETKKSKQPEEATDSAVAQVVTEGG